MVQPHDVLIGSYTAFSAAAARVHKFGIHTTVFTQSILLREHQMQNCTYIVLHKRPTRQRGRTEPEVGPEECRASLAGRTDTCKELKE